MRLSIWSDEMRLGNFKRGFTNRYNKVTGHIPTIYVSEAGDGAREIVESLEAMKEIKGQ